MESNYDEQSASEDEGLSVGSQSEPEEEGEGAAAELGLDTSAPEFYDPTLDEKDERWAARLRRGHKSDAVLSCPLCFTTLCVDCQQHARYEHQFRAMFVMNCKVITKQVVRVPAKPARQKKRKQQPEEAGGEEAAGGGGRQLEQQQQQQQQQQQPGAGGPQQQPQQQGGGAGGAGAAEGGGEVLNPVECAACGTEVGLRDGEGVYHFFNVFASNA